MSRPADPDGRARAVLALAVGVIALATPARALWAREDAPWWAPFLVWAALCLLGAWLARRERPDA